MDDEIILKDNTVIFPDGTKISVGNDIVYQPTSRGRKLSKGTVNQLRYADKKTKDSVWAYIKDKETGESDYISMAVHYWHKLRGEVEQAA